MANDFTNINDLIQFRDSSERYNRILWLQSLEEAIEEGDTESALAAIRAAIKLEQVRDACVIRMPANAKGE